MPRYISRRRINNTGLESTFARALDAQQQEYLRLLRRESEKLLGDFKESIARALREHMEQTLRASSNSGRSSASATGSNDGFSPSFGGIANFLGGALRIYLGRPKYAQSTAETERSRQTQSQFRAARAESLAEMTSTLSQGERNQ